MLRNHGLLVAYLTLLGAGAVVLLTTAPAWQEVHDAGGAAAESAPHIPSLMDHSAEAFNWVISFNSLDDMAKQADVFVASSSVSFAPPLLSDHPWIGPRLADGEPVAKLVSELALTPPSKIHAPTDSDSMTVRFARPGTDMEAFAEEHGLKLLQGSDKSGRFKVIGAAGRDVDHPDIASLLKETHAAIAMRPDVLYTSGAKIYDGFGQLFGLDGGPDGEKMPRAGVAEQTSAGFWDTIYNWWNGEPKGFGDNEWRHVATSKSIVDMNTDVAHKTTTGARAHILVYDDGYDETNPQLPELTDSYDFGGLSVTDLTLINDNFAFHGTAAAGMAVAAKGECARGTAPDAKLSFARIAFRSGEGLATFQWANGKPKNTFSVMSNSWGTKLYAYGVPAFDPAINAEINSLAFEKETVVLFAAGNGGYGGQRFEMGSYFSAEPGIAAIGGCANTGKATQYTTPGAQVMLCGPTGDTDYTQSPPKLLYFVETTDVTGPAGYSDSSVRGVGKDNCGGFDGTSAATPAVAGVIALMKDRDPGLLGENILLLMPSITNYYSPGVNKEEIVTAAGLRWNPYTGFGLIDASKAIRNAVSYRAGANLGGRAKDFATTVDVTADGATHALPDGGNIVLLFETNLNKVLKTDAEKREAAGLRIAFVQVVWAIQHPSPTDVVIVLVGPGKAGNVPVVVKTATGPVTHNVTYTDDKVQDFATTWAFWNTPTSDFALMIRDLSTADNPEFSADGGTVIVAKVLVTYFSPPTNWGAIAGAAMAVSGAAAGGVYSQKRRSSKSGKKGGKKAKKKPKISEADADKVPLAGGSAGGSARRSAGGSRVGGSSRGGSSRGGSKSPGRRAHGGDDGSVSDSSSVVVSKMQGGVAVQDLPDSYAEPTSLAVPGNERRKSSRKRSSKSSKRKRSSKSPKRKRSKSPAGSRGSKGSRGSRTSKSSKASKGSRGSRASKSSKASKGSRS